MKRSRRSEEQIIGYLKQIEAGRTVKDLAQEPGGSEATLDTCQRGRPEVIRCDYEPEFTSRQFLAGGRGPGSTC
jgi:hypothetical protein